MKRLAIILAAVIIFTTAWSVSESQKQLDREYKQLFAQTDKQETKKTKTEPKNTAVATPEKPSDAPTVENVQTPEPVVQATQTAPVAVGGCENYRSIVAQYDWDVRTAMAVMQQESTNPQTGVSCDPNIANMSDNHMSWAGCMGSFGLFQINCSHGAVYDPAQNVAIAYAMYKSRGWQPWTSYTSGEYAKYLR